MDINIKYINVKLTLQWHKHFKKIRQITFDIFIEQFKLVKNACFLSLYKPVVWILH